MKAIKHNYKYILFNVFEYNRYYYYLLTNVQHFVLVLILKNV